MKNFQKLPSKNYRKRDGVSLLIALGLVSVIVMFSAIAANIIFTSIRQAANVNRANEAYYAAEGALEQGLMENAKQGAGYSAASQSASPLNAEFTIQGQVPAAATYGGVSGYSGMYSSPAPGTGDVGTDCDPLTAVTTTAFKYMSGSVEVTEDEPANNPCNWNKIGVGEVVAIPLYYTDSSGDHNLVTSASDLITVRVRTACSNGDVMCPPIDRFDFDIANDAPNYGLNEPIMSWQITGEEAATKASMVLGPWIDIFGNPPMLQPSSTIISEFKIKGGLASGLFEVLNQSNLGEDLNKCTGPLLTYLRPAEANTCANGSNWSTTTIKKPVLKLSVIQSMIAPLGETIPHLEYQVLTDFSTAPPTDTSQTITAEGYSGEFKQILEVKQPQEGGLLEYVIQQ